MSIRHELKNEIPVIYIENEDELVKGSEFYNIINSYINNEDKKKFVLDITALNSLNSTGIGVIVKTALRLEELSGKIAIASVSQRTKQLFTLANITDIVEILEDIDAAIHYLNTV